MLWAPIALYAAVMLYIIAWLSCLLFVLTVPMMLRNLIQRRRRGSTKTLKQWFWGLDADVHSLRAHILANLAP